MEDTIDTITMIVIGLFLCLLIGPTTFIILFVYVLIVLTILEALKSIIRWAVNLLIH